ncbi:MAG: IS3 family transposase, partial [Ignavibacteria bacterium]
MRDEYSHIGLARLCAWFGLTRQAYYRYRSIAKSKSIEEALLLQEILNIRKSHRRMGTRKLYDCLRPFMTEHGIKLGRDSLFSLVSAHNLQVRRRKSRVRTTQ